MEVSEPELKGILNDMLNGYIGFISAEPLLSDIDNMISKNYNKGLEQGELQFDMNFIPNYEALNFVQKFAFENVKGLAEDTKENLRKEMSLGLLNNESMTKLRQRIIDVMDASIERAKLIQITESNRAHNAGHLQTMRESRLNLYKQWSAQPERISRSGNEVPCKHCEFLDGQIVELEEKFIDDEGKEFMQPPHHPNCACRILAIQKEDV